MATKSSSKQTKKADSANFKSLLPALLFGTAVVVLIGYLGRKTTEQ